MENRFDEFLSDRDKLVFGKTGYGGRVGFGARPVVLVVDVSYAFCGEEPLPLLDAIAASHNSCGEDAWRAVDVIARLLAAARSKRLPIFYTTGFSQPIAGTFGLGRWTDKCPPEAEDDPLRANEIVAPIAPRLEDVVMLKTMPSAFFATNFISYLVNLAADSIIVCGVATSGCVRATVVDGFSHNYRMIVVAEGTFDRGEASHWISLFDMDMKYSDVMGIDDTLAHLASVEPGVFDDRMPLLAAAARRHDDRARAISDSSPA